MKQKKKQQSLTIYIAIILTSFLIMALSALVQAIVGVIVGLFFFVVSIAGIISVQKQRHSEIAKPPKKTKASQDITLSRPHKNSSIPITNIPSTTANQSVRIDKVPTPYKIEKFHVTGTSHYQQNIESLGDENYDFELSKKELIEQGFEGEKIFLYEFSPSKVELVEEPDNPYDPNAIKVVIDNVLVGYIKKGSCSHIKKLLHSGKIKKIDADIYGGKYKLLYSDYDYEKDKEIYYVEKDKSDYHVTIEISIEE